MPMYSSNFTGLNGYYYSGTETPKESKLNLETSSIVEPKPLFLVVYKQESMLARAVGDYHIIYFNSLMVRLRDSANDNTVQQNEISIP